MKVAVVDFDKTLVRVDSAVLMLKTEGWYLSPSLLFWGGIIWVLRFFASYKAQYFFRRKFRYALFHKIIKQGREAIIAKYTDLLVKEINDHLIEFVTKNYEAVYVSTAAWQPLVEAVLKAKGLSWPVQGTEYNEDFKNFFTCWHQEKVRRLEQIGLKNFDVFTDSLEDTPLMNAGENVYLVTGKSFALWPKKS